jgi:hypothetical protein
MPVGATFLGCGHSNRRSTHRMSWHWQAVGNSDTSFSSGQVCCKSIRVKSFLPSFIHFIRFLSCLNRETLSVWKWWQWIGAFVWVELLMPFFLFRFILSSCASYVMLLPLNSLLFPMQCSVVFLRKSIQLESVRVQYIIGVWGMIWESFFRFLPTKHWGLRALALIC